MALTIGINCGFVTTAPTVNPNESLSSLSGRRKALKDTTTSGGTIRITEIGWYKDTGTSGECDVGIYTEGNTIPVDLIHKSEFAFSSSNNWYSATGLSIDLSPSTDYWIALQVNSGTTATVAAKGSAGVDGAFLNSGVETELPDPWGTSSSSTTTLYGLYAVYEIVPEGINIQVNISDVWKPAKSMQINIGNSWKVVTKIQQNIGNTWKTVF